MSDLNVQALKLWLKQSAPQVGEVQDLEKFPGGQSNPTYRLMASGGNFVLRRKPFGPLLPSAHAVDREFKLLSGLHPLGFPVPQPVALCDQDGVIGSMFYIMEMVDGQTYWDATLPDIEQSERRGYLEALVDTQAALHQIDVSAAGLGGFGAPGNYVGRQVERWTKQYRAAQTDDIPEVENLIEWLSGTVPEQSRTSIIHGDYRLDNLIFSKGCPRVLAVLDWELATIGDPLADFAYLAMHWAMPPDGRSGLAGLDLDALGLPTLEEVVARYCAATGRASLPDLHWYFAYNMFRLVGILQGIKKRIATGNASSAQAHATILKIEPLSKAAWEQARLAGAPA